MVEANAEHSCFVSEASELFSRCSKQIRTNSQIRECRLGIQEIPVAPFQASPSEASYNSDHNRVNQVY